MNNSENVLINSLLCTVYIKYRVVCMCASVRAYGRTPRLEYIFV